MKTADIKTLRGILKQDVETYLEVLGFMEKTAPDSRLKKVLTAACDELDEVFETDDEDEEDDEDDDDDGDEVSFD